MGFLCRHSRARAGDIHALVSGFLDDQHYLRSDFRREDAQPQVDRFPGSSHKKYPGWSAATSAWDASRRPRSLLAPSASPVKVVRSENGDGQRSNKGMSIAPAPAPSTRVKAERSSVSAPSTPTRQRKKTLYVYSGATETTIYADQ